jgi:NAD(P)-dependent dehydrogenase (short-subunit alcohol dehydrogenase family)
MLLLALNATREVFMRTIVIGTSTIGNAVTELFREQGHEVIQVGRSSGEVQADLTDPDSLRRLFSEVPGFDAVAVAAGEVFPAGLAAADDDQWARSIASKGMGQIDVVRAATPRIADGGSFTLVSGILGDEVGRAMTIGATVNRMVEGFVTAAATELPRGIRINCVSPTVLEESIAYHPYFPGFVPVPARDVALAYLRAATNPYTGRIMALHRMG